jgi:hypothetical protein
MVKLGLLLRGNDDILSWTATPLRRVTQPSCRWCIRRDRLLGSWPSWLAALVVVFLAWKAAIVYRFLG